MKRQKMSGEKLAAYLGNAIPIRTIQSICSQAGEESTGGYDMQSALTAIVIHLKKAAEKISTEREKSLARSAKARAATDEVESMLAIGSAVLAADLQPTWEDAVTRWRVVIETFPGLTELQREQIIARLATIKLSGEEEA